MQQADILRAIQADQCDYDWVTVESGPVAFRVFADALKIDGVRAPVSWETTQEAAMLLGAHPTTAKIEDLVHKAANVAVPPFPFNPSQYNIQAWSTIAAHNAKIEEVAGPQLDAKFRQVKQALENSLKQCLLDSDPRIVVPPQLVSTVGKSWVATARGGAVNYGWHGGRYNAVTPGLKVWQSEGRRHNAVHWDYSQTLRLVHQVCHVNGEPTTIRALLRSPELCRHIAHDGPYPQD